MKGTIKVLLHLSLLSPVFVFAAPSPSTDYRATPAFPALRFNQPLYIAHPKDGTDRLFVVEQAGRIFWFENKRDVSKKNLALDITKKVRREHMEEGLLGLAFHPKIKENHRVFLQYSASHPRRNVISRFLMDASHGTIRPETEEVLMEIEQPYGNHNGGMLDFGPDGCLYISLGDGGSGGDPHDNAQNKKVLLGKILRIDVDKKEGGKNYAVPTDNPFVNKAGARPEIWAWGLRNVWRFSFDRQTGILWAGDVGQVKWEEIDLIEKGKNYGWNRREGFHSYSKKLPYTGPYQDPVMEHGRNVAQSITGGYVYRGEKLKVLTGHYVYGDFVTGNIWVLDATAAKPESRIITRGALISSFGEDRDGELYFTSYDGNIYTLEKNSE